MNIHICFSSDNNYAQHMAAAMVSILRHAAQEDEYCFHVLDGGICPESKEKLGQLIMGSRHSILYHDFDTSRVEACPITGYVDYITRATYFRFFIPEILPDVDKVLYLDCDVIINDDIGELFRIDLGDKAVAVVPDVNNPYQQQRMGYPQDHYYFNAGVLLINNKKWREENIQQKLFKYTLAPTNDITYQDQDVLNEVLYDSLVYLPIRWNVGHDAKKDGSYPYHEEEHRLAMDKPSIVHYTNPVKPWNPECDNPWAYLYLDALKASPWKEAYARLRGRIIRFRVNLVARMATCENALWNMQEQLANNERRQRKINRRLRRYLRVVVALLLAFLVTIICLLIRG